MTGYGRSPAPSRRTEPANLADILERVLDKGIVIAGDIQVNLLDIELLTIKLRLVIASVDRAKEMGIDWWEHDPTLSSSGRNEMAGDMAEENRRLRDRIEALEAATATAADERAEEVSPAADRRVRRPVGRRDAAETDADDGGPDSGRRERSRERTRERTGRSRLDASEEDRRG
jgi:hypothetical protein